MPTPHIHEKEIIAWAQGMQIEYEDCGWHDCTEHPAWDLNTRYRVKPAAPKWPQTTMGAGALIQAYQDGAKKGEALICAANAVIAHECSTGQLVPADKVREIEAKGRAEGIKEGVSEAMKVSTEFAREIALQTLQMNDIYPTSDELSSILAKVYP